MAAWTCAWSGSAGTGGAASCRGCSSRSVSAPSDSRSPDAPSVSRNRAVVFSGVCGGWGVAHLFLGTCHVTHHSDQVTLRSGPIGSCTKTVSDEGNYTPMAFEAIQRVSCARPASGEHFLVICATRYRSSMNTKGILFQKYVYSSFSIKIVLNCVHIWFVDLFLVKDKKQIKMACL